MIDAMAGIASRLLQGLHEMNGQHLLIAALVALISFGANAQVSERTELREREVGSPTGVKQPASGARAKSGSIIWGAGAAVGQSDGQFANPFVQATSYSAGDNPTSWTAVSINDAAGTPGNAYWTRSLTGVSQGGYFGGQPPISSPSQSNGVALFDSDFMDNGGAQGAFGTGSSPSPHRGELISPRIDLTGYTDQALAITFHSYHRHFAISELSVSMSTDDGATWSAPVDYLQPPVNAVFEGLITASFPDTTGGVANLTQSRIKLVFAGDYYFAMVDDLSVQTTIDYDLALGVVDAEGNDLFSQGDYVHITGNRYFPISQLVPDARHFAFGGNIRNLGTLDVQLATNPLLELVIEKDVEGTWMPVFNAAIAATEIIPAQGDIWLGDLIADYSWVETGDYRAIYTASFDGTDGDPTNNSLTHFFSITFDYASVVDMDVTADPLATGSAFPGGSGSLNAVEYGSVFYFDAATAAGLKIGSIALTYRVPPSFSAANVGADQELLAFVYAVDPSSGILDDSSLLTAVGVCPLSLTGLGDTVLPGEYRTARCAPVSVNMGEPLPALTTGHYFISVRIQPGVSFEANDVPWFGVSDLKNYFQNIALTDPGAMINVSPLSITDAGGVETWYWTGFGADRVPSIGVDLSGELGANAAPTVTAGASRVIVGLEDNTDSAGTDLATLVGGAYEDADNDPFAGAALDTNAPISVNGEWQYRLGAAGAWNAIPTSGLSSSSALLLAPAASLRFVPAADFFGPIAPLSLRLWDGTGSASYTFGLGQDISQNIGSPGGFSDDANRLPVTAEVTPVNDAPTFMASTPPGVVVNAPAQTVTGWVESFLPGPVNESGQQALGYAVSAVSNPGLFAVAPTVAINGSLSYTLAEDATGSSDFSVSVRDDGGVLDGGVDTSESQTFTITVLTNQVFCSGFETGGCP